MRGLWVFVLGLTPLLCGFSPTGAFWNSGVTASVPADPCFAKSFGQACAGGIYAGSYKDLYSANNRNLIVTPSGCATNVATPTCAGGTDTMTLEWATNTSSHGGTDVNSGDDNTAAQAVYAAVVASKFCANLVYGGFSDWYLPAIKELEALYDVKNVVGGFASNYYWSSTQNSGLYAKSKSFSNGFSNDEDPKATNRYVRCVRTYYP